VPLVNKQVAKMAQTLFPHERKMFKARRVRITVEDELEG
jgi:hypothetical protein